MPDASAETEPAETAGWRAVGVVLDGDPIDLGGGVNPWKHSWHPLDTMVWMRHPSWPTQLHDLPAYSIIVGDRTVVFAAGELSNQVWGFYVPVD